MSKITDDQPLTAAARPYFYVAALKFPDLRRGPEGRRWVAATRKLKSPPISRLRERLTALAPVQREAADAGDERQLIACGQVGDLLDAAIAITLEEH